MMMVEFIKNLQLFTSQNTGINMAQESIDDFIQMAKDYAKAEKELGVQHWVFVSIERKGEFGDRERIYSYDLPRELYERRKWVIRWRAAKLQCQYPKDSINCYLSYYDNRLGNDLKLTDDLRTLISCKAQVIEHSLEYELKKISLEDYEICSEPSECDPYPPYRERLHPRKHWQRKPYWLRTRSNPKKKGYH